MYRKTFLAAALLSAGIGLSAAAAFAPPAAAATFKWANDGDANSLDPYTRSETFQLSFDENIYEPLVRRDAHLKLEPGLATSWKQIKPDVWRFKLRPNVKFQGGEPFTADDVVFSFHRATSADSNIQGYFHAVKDVRKVDDLTVDFRTKALDPIFPQEITNWMIMSKAWCEAHNAAMPANLTKREENFATRNADGTGPFILKLREPDRRTVMVKNPHWWGKQKGNVTEADFYVISNASTRVAALLSGQVDMIYSVPPQDIPRLSHAPGFKIAQAPELRTVFLGMDQSRPQLLKSTVKGKNPFKDRRVRLAFYEAINDQAIHTAVMRGLSHVTGMVYGPGVNGYDPKQDTRYPYDPANAKKLLAAAGYPHGFGVTMDCPNDRYVNDSQICQAVSIMLAKVGVQVTVNAQTKLKFFSEINAPTYHTSFYILGWAPDTYDALNSLYNLGGTRDGVRGIFNSGGYSSPAFDALLRKIQVQTDETKRNALIGQASALLRKDVAYIPLHQQVVVWAMKKNIQAHPQPDNYFPLRYVVVGK